SRGWRGWDGGRALPFAKALRPPTDRIVSPWPQLENGRVEQRHLSGLVSIVRDDQERLVVRGAVQGGLCDRTVACAGAPLAASKEALEDHTHGSNLSRYAAVPVWELQPRSNQRRCCLFLRQANPLRNTVQRTSMSHKWEFALGYISEGWLGFLGNTTTACCQGPPSPRRGDRRVKLRGARRDHHGRGRIPRHSCVRCLQARRHAEKAAGRSQAGSSGLESAYTDAGGHRVVVRRISPPLVSG